MSNRFLSSAIFSGLTTALATAGEVTTDGSMGASQTLTGPNYTIGQDLGTTVGNNLFHSFGTFNLNQGDVATFTGANTIQNVISRVTDGNPSSIDGTIQSQVGTANFFFINPAGIVFGQHAAIDVPAAFHASTANELRFADGSSYNLHTSKGNLTAAAPESFGFLGRTGDIVIEGSQLKFKEGTEVSFTGGSVTSNNATIEVPRGSLRVYGNGDAVSNVAINGELPIGNGAITINGGGLDTSGNGGGNVAISGGSVSVINGAYVFNDNHGSLDALGQLRIVANTLLIDSGWVKADAMATGNAGNIIINVSGGMQVLNGGVVSSSTFASGDAGSVSVTAGSLTIDSQGSENFTGITSQTGYKHPDATGNAETVSITVAGQMQVLNGGEVSSGTFAQGDAGSVSITAGSLIIDGQGAPYFTGIASQADSGIGNAGPLNITVAGQMQVLNGGEVSSGTFAQGDAGSVSITAGSLIIDGQGSPNFTGITSQANPSSSGNAGPLNITVAGQMQVLNGGVVSSSTFAQGDAGSVSITAGSLIIDGQGASNPTGIASQAGPSSSGNAGPLNITVAGQMQVLNGGVVSSSTFAQGDAGSVSVTAGSLIIDRQGASNVTGIISQADSGSGNAGPLNITVAGQMQVLNGGIVSSGTFAQGDAGSVSITAGSLIIDGQGSPKATGIASQANFGSSGNAGPLNINVAGQMQVLNGGVVSSSTLAQGDAVSGSVSVTAGSLIIDGQGASNVTGIISQANSGSGNAGTVNITVAGQMQVLNGGIVSSNTFAQGDAGSVSITAGSLIIDGQGSPNFTGITSQANPSSSGNASETIIINVVTNMLVINGGQVSNASFASGKAGSIVVSVGGLLYLANDAAIKTTAKISDGGPITITASAIVLNNSQITTSVLGTGGNGGDITLNGGYLVLDTGFIQANTVGENAKGGDIFVNMDGVLPNGGVTIVGGEHRDFIPHSGQNVIQAAANATENDGTITITNPSDSSAAGLTGAANRLEPIQIAKNPCIGIKKRASLRRKGLGGLNSGKDVIKLGTPVKNKDNEDAYMPHQNRESVICKNG